MDGSRTSSLAGPRAARSRSTPARGAALLAAATLALLAGCGQKGPLFLPPPARPASHPATAAPATPAPPAASGASAAG